MYVASLDGDALAEPLPLGTAACPRWLIIAHVVNHRTQHRSELAHYLADCGHRLATSTCPKFSTSHSAGSCALTAAAP